MASSKIGIIPAAGKATRFGGLYKELLPLPDGRSLLEHAMDRLRFCDHIVIITNPEKADMHLAVVGKRASLQLQVGDEMWGAIKTAYNTHDADRYCMTMPDTYVKDDVFKYMVGNSFGMGLFKTDEPERFGILQDGWVTDKFKDAAKPANAWGVLSWAKHVCDIWNDTKVNNYTSAINTAITAVDYGTWNIGEYYDCADMQRYMELLWHLK